MHATHRSRQGGLLAANQRSLDAHPRRSRLSLPQEWPGHSGRLLVSSRLHLCWFFFLRSTTRFCVLHVAAAREESCTNTHTQTNSLRLSFCVLSHRSSTRLAHTHREGETKGVVGVFPASYVEVSKTLDEEIREGKAKRVGDMPDAVTRAVEKPVPPRKGSDLKVCFFCFLFFLFFSFFFYCKASTNLFFSTENDF